MLAFIRLFTATFSLLFGILTVLFFVFALGWSGWFYISGDIISGLSIEGPGHYQPWLISLFSTTIIVSVLLFVLFLLKLPENIVFLLYRKIGVTPIPKDSEIYELLNHTAKKMHIPTPNLYHINDDHIHAYAISTLYGSTIVISDKIVTQLSQDEISWVFAHELSHIDKLDALSSSFWLSSLYSLKFLKNIFQKFIDYVGRSFAYAGMPVVFVMLITLPAIILRFSIGIILRVSIITFTNIDKLVNSSIEKQCDKLASMNTHATHGLSLFDKLSKTSFEPYFDRMLTTPPNPNERQAHMRMMLEKFYNIDELSS